MAESALRLWLIAPPRQISGGENTARSHYPAAPGERRSVAKATGAPKIVIGVAPGVTRNLRSTLRRGRGRDPMRAFDAAPPELRRWLAAAALPWSPESAQRVYARALRRARGDVSAALAALAAREAALLAADARRIWGAAHPAAQAARGRDCRLSAAQAQ